MRLTLILAFGWLTACATSPISGSDASGVKNLSFGMSLKQVEDVVGFAAFRTPSGSVTCTSHAYGTGSAERFVQVNFEGGGLVTASDGHRDPC